MSTEQCRDCTFYRREKEEATLSAECRRFPPQRSYPKYGDEVDDPFSFAGPRVLANGWCGEWQATTER